MSETTRLIRSSARATPRRCASSTRGAADPLRGAAAGPVEQDGHAAFGREHPVAIMANAWDMHQAVGEIARMALLEIKEIGLATGEPVRALGFGHTAFVERAMIGIGVLGTKEID